jgi:hypothetical protein
LSQNGFYIVPNVKRPGYYDLPVLQSEVCGDLLTSHRKQLEEFTISALVLEQYCTEAQLTRLHRKLLPATNEDDDLLTSAATETVVTIPKIDFALVTLLEYALEHKPSAPAIYQIAVSTLMTQNSFDFIMVMDEFNCLFRQPGHYFHAKHDFNVVKSIPHEKITLFEPVMKAMGLSDSPAEEETAKVATNMVDESNVIDSSTTVEDSSDNNNNTTTTVQLPMTIQRGGVVVATTESHSVARKATDALIQSAMDDVDIDVIEIPRLSHLEVEHMLSHYEAIGVGKLRLDQGETVMNPQEVAYLRMVSGGEAQHLMNACMW